MARTKTLTAWGSLLAAATMLSGVNCGSDTDSSSPGNSLQAGAPGAGGGAGSKAGNSPGGAGNEAGGSAGNSAGGGAGSGNNAGVGGAGGNTPTDNVEYTGNLPPEGGHSTLTVAGLTRHVIAHVPPNVNPSPALVIALHGTGQAFDETGAAYVEDNHRGALGELGVLDGADAHGFIVVGPASTTDGGVNADHEFGGVGWQFTGTPEDNPDLLLVRALIVEASKTYQIDPARVYVVGHSNGAFFSYFVARSLGNRIAAFAENSGGLIPCGNRVDCDHHPAGATSCGAVMADAPAACQCAITEASFPGTKPPGRMPWGFLKHNADDSTVSPVFTCRLAEHLGERATVTIDGSGEHGVTNGFFENAWAFLSQHSLPD